MSTRTCVTVLLKNDVTDALPAEWTTWPTRMELAFSLTGGGAVNSEDYSRFKVASLREAARFLFNPRYQRRPLRYSLKTDGFLPAYRFDAEWSLLRRGCTGGVRQRMLEQRLLPWSHGADTTLFEIWRRPITQHTFKSRVWLRTGGRTEEEAVRHWFAVAHQMRREYRDNW